MDLQLKGKLAVVTGSTAGAAHRVEGGIVDTCF